MRNALLAGACVLALSGCSSFERGWAEGHRYRTSRTNFDACLQPKDIAVSSAPSVPAYAPTPTYTYTPPPSPPPPQPAADPNVHYVQLTREEDGGFSLPVTIGGVDISTSETTPITTQTFLLDTGASDVTIPADLAKRLIPPYVFIGEPHLKGAELADGTKVPTISGTLASLTVGGVTVKNVPCMITPPGSGPLLGQSFLQKFSAWAVGNDHNVLLLKS